MYGKVTIALLTILAGGLVQAAPSGKTIPVEIVAPEVVPVEINGITTPSMIPVDVQGVVSIKNPTFLPADIIETLIPVDGNAVPVLEPQVIREVIILPSPGLTTAIACRGRIFADDHPISIVEYAGDHPVSMPASLPGAIEVSAGTSFYAKLEATAGDQGVCSAEIVMYGTRLLPPQ